MKEFVCNKCGSVDMTISEKGGQVGLYCGDCGKWQKWLNKDEKRLAEQWIENIKTKTQVKPVKKDQIKFSELERASKPLIDFLNKYYNPMTIAIVTEGRVDILSNEMGMPLEVRD